MNYDDLTRYVREVEFRLRLINVQNCELVIYLPRSQYHALTFYHIWRGENSREEMRFSSRATVSWAPNLCEGAAPLIAFKGGDLFDANPIRVTNRFK